MRYFKPLIAQKSSLGGGHEVSSLFQQKNMFKYLVQQEELHGRNCDLMWKNQTQLLGQASEVALGKISNRFDKQMGLSNKYMLPLGQGARRGRNSFLDSRVFLLCLKSPFYIVSVVLMDASLALLCSHLHWLSCGVCVYIYITIKESRTFASFSVMSEMLLHNILPLTPIVL